jgi:hypothetical protein
MTRRFASMAEAARFLGPVLDRPEPTRTVMIGPGISLAVEAVELGGEAFSNLYTLSWTPPARAEIAIVDTPGESPWTRGLALARQGARGGVATGGFGFLADGAAGAPRTRSLNLAIRAGVPLSVPVIGQDALICRGGALSVEHVAAEGLLRLNGERLRWVGSRSGQAGECSVFGNANVRIEHRDDPRTGKYRHLVADSRRTPPLAAGSGAADVGFVRAADGLLRGAARADGGGLDIFAFDLVLRCPVARLRRNVHDDIAVVDTIGAIDLADPALETAISVGPSLLHPSLEAHPLHHEPSLGSTPLLGGRRASRLLYFAAADGRRSLQLWDARPDSALCPGVTLDEAVRHARARHDVVHGCFLDSGKSGKLCIADGDAAAAYGNRHYLRWPAPGDEHFVWTPDEGRPAASMIVVTAP